MVVDRKPLSADDRAIEETGAKGKKGGMIAIRQSYGGTHGQAARA
jgi:hypothetical protein